MNNRTTVILESQNKKNVEPLFFPRGLPGLAPYRHYRISSFSENPYFFLLQAVKEQKISLILVDPFPFYPAYHFRISEAELKELKVQKNNDLLVFNTVTAWGGRLYTNLAAPLLINPKGRRGKQLILADMQDQLRAPLDEGPGFRGGGKEKGDAGTYPPGR